MEREAGMEARVGERRRGGGGGAEAGYRGEREVEGWGGGGHSPEKDIYMHL